MRPVTYIQRVIDPKWQPLLITPPFPEYPSGHSTQSSAAAMVLTSAFGADYAFEDATHANDGLPSRGFPSFEAAADEAGISRLYGGIHFRSAIERGLAQGRCVGAYSVALRDAEMTGARLILALAAALAAAPAGAAPLVPRFVEEAAAAGIDQQLHRRLGVHGRRRSRWPSIATTTASRTCCSPAARRRRASTATPRRPAGRCASPPRRAGSSSRA